MNFEIWVLYVITVLVLMSTPGSGHILMISNSSTYGFKNAMATALGDLSANVLQMLAAALGIGVLVASSDKAISVIKWLGVAYLLWHAIRIIKNAKPLDFKNSTERQNAPLKTLYLQGFLTAATNPKAILFFTALFPQFMVFDNYFWLQFFILATTFVAIDGLFLCLYGMGAGWLASFVKPQNTIWVVRVSGLLMVVAAILLGLKSLDGLNVTIPVQDTQ